MRALDDLPYHSEAADGDGVWIIDFGLALPGDAEVALERVRPLFHEAFDAMWSGSVEPDSLNQLVLAAELSAREISVLRAYSRYLRQAGFTFSLPYVQQTLVAPPSLARPLVNLFEAGFGPIRGSSPATGGLVR